MFLKSYKSIFVKISLIISVFFVEACSKYFTNKSARDFLEHAMVWVEIRNSQKNHKFDLPNIDFDLSIQRVNMYFLGLKNNELLSK